MDNWHYRSEDEYVFVICGGLSLEAQTSASSGISRNTSCLQTVGGGSVLLHFALQHEVLNSLLFSCELVQVEEEVKRE